MKSPSSRHLVPLIALAVGCTQAEQKPQGEAPGQPAAEPAVVRITAIPDENPTELLRKFGTLAAHLERELGAKVKYVPVTDYGAVVQGMAAKQVEFAWLGGFTFVQAKVMAGAVPLVMRDIDRKFQSVFVAYVDSGVEKLEDLKGKSFSFGSKSSTSGHLMPRHFMMTVASINPDADLKGAPIYSGAHDATAKMVESGKVDAGALNMVVWDRMVAEQKIDTSKVKVFWTTPGYVDYVWAASGGVPSELQEKFRKAFLQLDPLNPEHKALIDLQGGGSYVAAAATDFDAIESVARATGMLK